MKDRDDRIEGKLDRVVDKIGAIDSTLAAQHVTLEEHIRRTALLEEDMKPVKQHVAVVHGLFKAIGFAATIAASMEGIVWAIRHL